MRWRATYSDGTEVSSGSDWGTTAVIDRSRLRIFQAFSEDSSVTVQVPHGCVLMARLRSVHGTDGTLSQSVIAAVEGGGEPLGVWVLPETGDPVRYDGYGAPGVWKAEPHPFEAA